MCIFKKKICVTHDGTFHADDIFSTAVFYIINNGNIKIIRTRDQKVFLKANYLYDVGEEYNPDLNKFDHHQNGSPLRENGIPYAAFGLIWKKYGEQICWSKNVADKIEKKIVLPIDMSDNGIDISTPVFKSIFNYTIDDLFKICFPTWKENDKYINKIFKAQVLKAVELLKREIKIAKDDVEGEKILIESYNQSQNKKILILNINLPRYLYQNFLSRYSETIYIILPSKNFTNWKIEAIRKNENTLESKRPFPENWRGVTDKDELIKISGISDIQFCHKNGFLSETKTKEGAISLAEKSLIS